MSKKACFVLVLLVLLFFKHAVGATRTAVANGNWATNSVWDCNCAPAASDNIVIPAGITVTVSSLLLNLSNVANINITVNGTLVIQDSTIYLDNGDVMIVNAGGKIQATGLLGGSVTQGVSFPLLLLTGQSMAGPFEITAGALPITLVYFHVSASSQGFRVEWQSASEINFSHYLLQKSVDGIEFTDMAEIPPAAAAVDGSRTYIFEDQHLICKTNIYYQLVSIDLDGSATTHKNAATRYEGPCEPKVTFFPNPVTTSELNWETNFLIEHGDQVKIFYQNGALAVIEELNENQTRVKFDLPSGLYFLMLFTKHKTFVQNFMIRQ